MDNPNMPIIAVNLKTGQWEKIVDSSLPASLARLGEDSHIYRVDKEATVIRRKDGQLVIRGISFRL